MDLSMEMRGVMAASAYLEGHGYEVMPFGGEAASLVAERDGAFAFVAVSVHTAGDFREEDLGIERMRAFEHDMIGWMEKHPDKTGDISCDSIQVRPASEGTAVLRHAVNIFSH